MRKLIAALLLALLPAVALAQSSAPPTLGYHTVWGRLGVTPGDVGPGQAIPFATLLAQITGTESANTVWAGPTSGGAALPTWRALVGADLPAPGASSLGGVNSLTCSTSNWFNTLSTAGAFGCSQPAFSDISGTATGAQLPVPSATTLGGVKSLAAVSHNYLTSITTAGLPVAAQPTCTDLSDATYCNTAAGQFTGIATNTAASSGNVGQVIVQNILVGSAVGLTNNTAANIASLTLTAGDWDLSAEACFHGAATTVTSVVRASISTTSATENAVSPNFSAIGYPASSAVFSTSDICFAINANQQLLSGSQQYWLVGFSNFATSTLAAYGQIRARRMR